MRTSFSEKARSLLLAAIVALLALAGCGPISLSEEAQLGHNFAQAMRKELPILHDRVVTDYVREMGHGIVMAAGPTSTTKMPGKMNTTSGKISFTAVFAAFSSAICLRRVRIESLCTRNACAMLDPNLSAWIRIEAKD